MGDLGSREVEVRSLAAVGFAGIRALPSTAQSRALVRLGRQVAHLRSLPCELACDTQP